jgi:serine protease Do
VARKSPDGDSAKPPAVSSIGIAVSELTDVQKRELKVKNGVRVERSEGAAARAGIRENDVILSVDNVEVTSAKQFETVMGKLDKSKPVTMLIRQGDGAKFVIVRPVK